MLTRAELKANAKEQLKERWGNAVLVMLVYIAVSGALSGIPSFVTAAVNETVGNILTLVFSLITLIVTPPIALGLYAFFLKLSRGQDGSANDLFSKFDMWKKALGLTIMISIFTFLWSCLFVIPGIIAALRYSQAFYILLDNPEISPSEAIARSKEMMNGHKMDYFVLELSFIGWIILGTVTCGLGLLWVGPYMYTTYANFYNVLLDNSAKIEQINYSS